jgi:SAM-dependent methyltransferase
VLAVANSIVPVKALPHNAPYKIHRYFARRPWNAFDAMIEALTKPGDIVLDPFAGGGTTIYESAKLGRAAIGCDINPLSNFIVRNMLVASDGAALTEAAEEIVTFIKSISELSLPNCSKCMAALQCDWLELQHVSACPDCGTLTTLSEANKLRPGVYSCANHTCKSHAEGFRTAKTPRLKPIYKSMVLSCTGCTHKLEIEVDSRWQSIIDNNIRDLEELAAKSKVPLDQTDIPRNWDRQKEDLIFEKGFVKFSDLFTRRNFLINSLLKNHIISTYRSSDQYEALRFIFSDSLRDTNSMAFTNKAWQAGKPTTWSKHAYWLPNEFCEVNVAKAFGTSYKALASSHLFNTKHKFAGRLIQSLPSDMDLSPSEVFLHSGPIETLELKPESVDAVITDPPYGSNVQYLELSHFWYPWNSDIYQNAFMDSKGEAVVNRKDGFDGAKGYVDYEENLYRVFSSSFIALKPSGSLALTFNNKDLRAWVALIMSILRAGFRYIPESIVFQDGVQNYKQTAHTRFDGSPFGDFVYAFIKPLSSDLNVSRSDVVDTAALSKKIDSITGKAFSLLETGVGREQVLTKYFDKLVLVIQDAYLSSDLDTDGLYRSISASQLGKFYSEGK